MSDSNITRSARKKKSLTHNQFIRAVHHSRSVQIKQGYIAKEPLFYFLTLIQAMFDVKELKTDSMCQYPLSTMLVCIYKIAELNKIPMHDYIPDISQRYGDFYLSMRKVETGISGLIDNFRTTLFNIKFWTQREILKPSIVYILNSIYSLIKECHFNTSSIYYIGEQYILKLNSATDKARNNRSIKHREKYLRRTVTNSRSVIERTLSDKFEEIIK